MKMLEKLKSGTATSVAVMSEDEVAQLMMEVGISEINFGDAPSCVVTELDVDDEELALMELD
jgi:hypothetical protein